LISNIFYYSIKLYAISSRTKSIQQGLYFPWFLKRATTLGKNIIKNKIGIAIKFCKCYVIKRSPSNFWKKTQLKIKIKTDFFLTGSNPTRTKLGLRSNFYKCYVINRSPSNFLNKTQLKKIKIEFFLTGVGPSSMHLALNRTRSGRISREWNSPLRL